jgi:hypothetical protein
MLYELHELQATFGQALLAADAGPVTGALVSDRIPAGRRFAVHVNNVFGLLGGALEAAFPVVCRLVGTPFFQRAAQVYIARNPPSLPHLAVYGGGFADFLADFPPAAGVPYLACVARLEWARVEAYFAPDRAPLDPARLQALPAAVCPDLVFRLHPSVRLIRSPWPVVRLWQVHQHDPVAPVDPLAGPEAALVLRPDVEVTLTRLDPGDAVLVAALAAGATLAEAAAVAGECEAGFDLQGALAGHLARGSFCDVTVRSRESAP